MQETQTALFMKLLVRRGESHYVYVCVMGEYSVIQGEIWMTDCCWQSGFYILALSLSLVFFL